MKSSKTCVIPDNVVPEWEERMNGSGKTTAENFPKLMKDTDPQN